MVKTKRKIGAILITAILAVALATGMFCFAGGGTISAFAEGETAGADITAEELSAVAGLWKVKTATDNAETPAYGNLTAFGSKVAYVEDGKYVKGKKDDYYVYYATGIQGAGESAVTYIKNQRAELDTSVTVKTVTVPAAKEGDEPATQNITLNDIIKDGAAITYENNVKKGEYGKVTVVESKAKFITKQDKEIVLTKEWAIVTEPAVFATDTDGGSTAYKPHADGKKIVFGSATGDEIAEPKVVSGVDGVTTVYLRIDIVSNVRTEPLIKFYWVDNTGIYIDKGTDSHSPADGYHGKGEEVTWATEMASLYAVNGEAQSGKYTMTFTLPQEQAVELEKTGKPYAPLEVSFNIEQIDLNGVDTDDKNFYRAEPVNATIIYGQSTPTVKIEKKSGMGADATYTEDKTVTFDYGNRNNLDAGSQVPVTVKGTGNYKGEFTVMFEIERAKNKLGVSLSSWDYGAFAADKNKIAVNATEGAEKTQYTVKRKNEQGGFEAFDDVLTEFLLENGAYTNEVAEKLNGLVAGEYRLEAEIQETAIDNHTGIQYLHSDRINGYPFEVHKTRYAHPVLTLIAGVNDTYSGGELSMIINGFDSRFMDISFTGIRWQDGVLYATDAGTYTATVTITNENCEWADNAESVTLKWTVNPKVLARPTDDRTDFTINGSDQTYNPAGFDDRYMTITGNVRDDAGTTVVTVELKDKKNYVWDNGSTDAITFGWHIDTADVAFAVTVCVLAALILACAAVAVMQFISHRQRMTVFAEIGERQRREPEELNENSADGEPNNEGGNE